MRRSSSRRFLSCAVACFLISGCRQEQKQVRGFPAGGSVVQYAVQSELQPGPEMPVRRVRNPFSDNAYAIGEGMRLYSRFNCAGCHANGGGAIGPPLMDDEWIYGSAPGNIFSVIVEGRPQGMPTYGGRIPEYQVWQLVTYVRSLSHLTEAQSSSRQTHSDRSEEARNR